MKKIPAFLLLLPLSAVSQPETSITASSQILVDTYRASTVNVDTFLTNNGDEWNLKGSRAPFRKITKIKFDRFKIVSSEQKTFRVDKRKDHEIDLTKGTGGITAIINTTDSISRTLTVSYNDTGRIFIHMLMKTYTYTSRPSVLFGKKDEPYESHMSTYWDATLIKINSETKWNMWGLDVLENVFYVDSFEMRRATGFKIGKKKKKDSLGITTGYVFLHDGNQVACVETFPEAHVWMRKDLSEEHRRVLGAAIIAVIVSKVQ